MLIKIKAKLPARGFRSWCEREWGEDPRNVYECMKFARNAKIVRKATSIREAQRLIKGSQQKAPDCPVLEASEEQKSPPSATARTTARVSSTIPKQESTTSTETMSNAKRGMDYGSRVSSFSDSLIRILENLEAARRNETKFNKHLQEAFEYIKAFEDEEHGWNQEQ